MWPTSIPGAHHSLGSRIKTSGPLFYFNRIICKEIQLTQNETE